MAKCRPQGGCLLCSSKWRSYGFNPYTTRTTVMDGMCQGHTGTSGHGFGKWGNCKNKSKPKASFTKQHTQGLRALEDTPLPWLSCKHPCPPVSLLPSPLSMNYGSSPFPTQNSELQSWRAGLQPSLCSGRPNTCWLKRRKVGEHLEHIQLFAFQ